VYDFHVEGSQNLRFAAGDIIEVTVKHRDGWWDGRANKRDGTFPASFVEVRAVPHLCSKLAVGQIVLWQLIAAPKSESNFGAKAARHFSIKTTTQAILHKPTLVHFTYFWISFPAK